MKKNLLPPYESNWSTPQFSVEQGFGICALFITFLWPSLESEFPKMSKDDAIVYGLFSEVGMGFETSAEWNKAIYRIKKIHKENQKNIKLSLKDIFLSIIELSNIHNARYTQGSIHYLINLLKDMLSHPEPHTFEWSIWTKAVQESCSKLYKSFGFNWLDDLREPETEDYP